MKTLCLYNPLASRVRPDRLRQILSEHPLWEGTVFFSVLNPEWKSHIRSSPRIIIYGGDGTIHHTVQNLVGMDHEIVFLPGGTANDFCHTLGLSHNLRKSVRLLENGETARFDTISANGRHVLTGGGFGMGFQVAHSANQLKTHPAGRVLRMVTGEKIYTLLMLWHALLEHPAKLGPVLEKDQSWDSRLIIFTNQKKLGKDILLAPETRNGDGQFHLVIFTQPSSPRTLRSILRIKSGHQNKESGLLRNEVKEVVLRFRSPVEGFGDGEEMPASDTWDLRCHHAALCVRIPKAIHL